MSCSDMLLMSSVLCRHVGSKHRNRFFIGTFKKSLTSKVTHMQMLSVRNNSILTFSIALSLIQGTRGPSSGTFI